MVHSKISSLAALSLLAIDTILAYDPIDIPACIGGLCDDCPVRFVDTLGFPQCAVYNTKDAVIDRGDYNAGENGGVTVYLNIPAQDPGCATIIRSPAGTQEIDCGQNIGTFYNPICAQVTFQSTFMIQYCCGTDDCKGAGAGLPRSIRGINRFLSKRSGAGPMMLTINGTTVEPFEIGLPPTKEAIQKRIADKATEKAATIAKEKREKAINAMLAKRANLDSTLNTRACSYTETSTTTSPGDTRVIEGPVTGEATITISSSQTVGWSQTVSAGISFEIFTASASFETSESETTTLTYAFPVPKGQTGFIVWTPFLQCTKGTLSGCSEAEAEACFPVTDSDGDLVGNYALQVRS